LPVVKSACPVDKKTERQHMKELLQSLEKQYPAIRQQVPALLKKGNLDRW
jgi:tRNA(Ile)-lysidine synthase TilS/MesJ